MVAERRNAEPRTCRSLLRRISRKGGLLRRVLYMFAHNERQYAWDRPSGTVNHIRKSLSTPTE